MPFQRVGGWGSNFTYVSYNTGMCCPNKWITHKKVVNMGPISTPQKDPETCVKFVEKWTKKIMEKILENW